MSDTVALAAAGSIMGGISFKAAAGARTVDRELRSTDSAPWNEQVRTRGGRTMLMQNWQREGRALRGEARCVAVVTGLVGAGLLVAAALERNGNS